MQKNFLPKAYKLRLRKCLMFFAILLLIASNLSATVLPNQVHAEESTEATQAAENPCPAPVALINGSFEQGAARGTAYNNSGYFFMNLKFQAGRRLTKPLVIK
ncbi:hypothetical protein AAGG52_01555 [Bacillus licheniformis]